MFLELKLSVACCSSLKVKLLRLPSFISSSSCRSLTFRMDCFVCLLRFQKINPNPKRKRETQLQLTESAMASFFEHFFPVEVFKKNESGIGLNDPLHVPEERLPQISGLPTTLNVLAGNLGTGPLKLL
nr:hypothetical protein Iba_chr08eCG10720 [Ipomoea batatas]